MIDCFTGFNEYGFNRDYMDNKLPAGFVHHDPTHDNSLEILKMQEVLRLGGLL
jgi:hypothetical protein